MQDVPKIVIERLPLPSAADPHPDPDLLAAFTERTLAALEREQVMGHLARCGVCREVMALASASEEMAGRTVLLPVRLGWMTRPSLRWVFAGVGTVAVFTFALLKYDQGHRPNEAAVLSSPQSQVVPPLPGPSSADVSTSTASKTYERQQSSRNRGNPPDARQASTARSNGNAVSHGDIPTHPAAVAGNRTSDALVRSQAPSGSPYQNYADVVKAKPAIAGQYPMNSQSMPAPPVQTSPALMLRASPRWAVTAAGGLQRSFDAGKTWEDVTITLAGGQIQAKPTFQVVTAVGPEVWAGGSQAVLYHSMDSGNRWQQVHPTSGGIAATGDISRIEFSDPQNGKVATSTGEMWITSDNGETWQKSQ